MTDLILMVALLMLGHYRMRATCVASSIATPGVPIFWRRPARGCALHGARPAENHWLMSANRPIPDGGKLCAA